jgi:hypothetical protein
MAAARVARWIVRKASMQRAELRSDSKVQA